ncbi:hypothetical protein ABPG74_020181 [Tetrahymena malaccensis]
MSHMSFRKELKQLQKSYIGICLQVIKPTFLIKEFVYSLDIQQDVDLIAKDQFVYVNVYDQDQKTNKMLILCLSEDYKKYSLFYQEITKKSLRSDLILNIIDHYYLDADRIFYVFEMDSFNFTSTQLEQKYQYAGLVSQAKNKIIKYCNESLNMYHFRNKQNYQEFYICITPQDKLKVKVNLIDPNWNIKQYFEKNLLLDYLQSHEKNKAEQQKNSKMEEEVENLEEQQYQITEMSKMIQDFEESLNQQIKKEDFVFIIQDMYSNILNYHPIEVFEMIQTRQKYDAFEILQSDEKKFELKVNKQSQIISLQGFQFSSLSKAQKLKSEYQFIISNKQLSSAIISVDLMIQENQYYVITENIFVELLDKQKNNLAELQNLQFSNENFILLSFLKFSYELLTKYDFQITKVKPQSLLLLDKDQISSDYQRNHIFNLRDQYEEKMKIYNMDQKKEKNYNYFQSSLKQFNVLDIDKLNDTFQKNKIKIQNQNTEKICNNNINMSLFTMGNNLNQFDPFGLNEIDLVLKRYLKEQKIVNFTIDAVSFDDFQSEYVHILNNSIRNNQNMKKYMDKKFKTEYQNSTYFQLIKLFFQKISENQKQVVSKIYDQLLIGFDIFNTISNLDSYDTFQNIQISNDDFTKVDIIIKAKNIKKSQDTFEYKSIMPQMSFRKELKQLQKSYIGICLQVIKPTFLIKEFVYSLDIQQDADLIAKDQFVYVNVYDQDQKTNKMLILCLSEDYKKYSLFYQEITKKSPRSDLILNIIDHYYLDADRIFYVFEMDSFNFTSTQLEQKYEYAGLFSQAKNKIIKYCNESLNMYHFRNKQNYQEFYICITPQDKLKVKVNLIDPNWNIEQYFEKNLRLDYFQSHENNKAEQQKNSKMEEEVEYLEEQQYQITEMSKMIQDFEESLNQQIKKEDFVFIIQDMYSNILNYHPIEVFEMIQTRQKYDTFQILQSDEKKFELKVNKQSQIISLQGFQFSSLSNAQKLKSEYQFIISNKQLSSAIISVDLMVLENQYYVITENTFVELLDKQKNNLAELQNFQFSEENFILLSFLKFSYELLTKYDFQITKVKPQSLLLLDKDQISSGYKRKHIFNLRDQYEEKMKIYNMDQKKEKNYNYFQSSLKQFNVLDIDKLNDTFQKNKLKIQNQNTEKICSNNINMSLFTMGNNLNQFDPFGLNEIDLVLKRYLKEQKIANFTIDAEQ